MVARSAVLKGAGAVAGPVVLLGVAAGGMVATGGVAVPTVQSTTYSWGEVTDETTEIRTNVTVENPNPVGVSGLPDIEHTAALNDVTLLADTVSGVGFGPGTSTVRTSAEMGNARIAEWWVTHVNGGERSTFDVTVTARVESQFGAERVELDSLGQSGTVETDIVDEG